MNKAGSAAKVKLNSFDDLFGASDMTAGTDQVQEIPLSDLYEFKGHPFKVLDDEKMQETVESIRNYGVLMPGIARPRAEGGYEIIAGHRRKHGCELAGLSTMPMFIRDYNDDEATVIMVDTNIQREDILPSEKARAYSMKYEAMKHQGKKGNGSLIFFIKYRIFLNLLCCYRKIFHDQTLKFFFWYSIWIILGIKRLLIFHGKQIFIHSIIIQFFHMVSIPIRA